MVTATLPEQTTSIKQPNGRPVETISTHKALCSLLEMLIAFIERLWREEVSAKTSEEIESPRQVFLRNVHQALGEWLEFESLNGEACP